MIFRSLYNSPTIILNMPNASSIMMCLLQGLTVGGSWPPKMATYLSAEGLCLAPSPPTPVTLPSNWWAGPRDCAGPTPPGLGRPPSVKVGHMTCVCHMTCCVCHMTCHMTSCVCYMTRVFHEVHYWSHDTLCMSHELCYWSHDTLCMLP